MFLTKNDKIKWKKLIIATALALLFVGLGVFWLDQPVFLFMRNYNIALWRWLEIGFSFAVWIAASVIVFAIMFAIDKLLSKDERRKTKNEKMVRLSSFVSRLSFYVFGAVMAAGAVAAILRFVLGRMRPVFFLALDRTGFYPGTFEWAFNSMPSGHTAASFAGLVMIGLWVPKWKWATWTLAILIGVSRICIGAHWPSDVILGAFIGMVTADFVKSALPRMLEKIKFKK